MRVGIATDHGGFDLKEHLVKQLIQVSCCDGQNTSAADSSAKVHENRFDCSKCPFATTTPATF